MNINYSQSTGVLSKDDGTIIAAGWSGRGAGKNNPDMENVSNTGPLPKGIYNVGAWEKTHGHLGPIVASLTQTQGDAFGRSAFYIHGPAMDPKTYGQESMGCIVIPRSGRLKIKALLPGPNDTVTVKP